MAIQVNYEWTVTEDQAHRDLACAVILEVAKMYIPDDTRFGQLEYNRRQTSECEEFFFSEDYEFWASIAGIEISGAEMFKALREHRGIFRFDGNK